MLLMPPSRFGVQEAKDIRFGIKAYVGIRNNILYFAGLREPQQYRRFSPARADFEVLQARIGKVIHQGGRGKHLDNSFIRAKGLCYDHERAAGALYRGAQDRQVGLELFEIDMYKRVTGHCFFHGRG
jgi:hypothetical protein